MLHWQSVRTGLDCQGSARYCRQPGKCRSSLHRIFHIHWEQTMSIFGKIMSAIFGTKADAAPAGGGAAAGTGSSAGSAAPAATVDVAPILDKAVATKGAKLEWRTSIRALEKGA